MSSRSLNCCLFIWNPYFMVLCVQSITTCKSILCLIISWNNPSLHLFKDDFIFCMCLSRIHWCLTQTSMKCSRSSSAESHILQVGEMVLLCLDLTVCSIYVCVTMLIFISPVFTLIGLFPMHCHMLCGLNDGFSCIWR